MSPPSHMGVKGKMLQLLYCLGWPLPPSYQLTAAYACFTPAVCGNDQNRGKIKNAEMPTGEQDNNNFCFQFYF